MIRSEMEAPQSLPVCAELDTIGLASNRLHTNDVSIVAPAERYEKDGRPPDDNDDRTLREPEASAGQRRREFESQETLEPRANILFGEICLKHGRYRHALDAYAIAGELDKVRECGDRLLDEGDLEGALKAYAAAGQGMSADRLIGASQRWLDCDRPDMAYRAYAALNQEIPDEVRMLFGDWCCRMGPGRYQDACRAYAEAGATDRLVLMGDRCLLEGRLDHALQFFEAARLEIPRQKLLSSGDRCLEEGWPGVACQMYLAAGATEKLLMCGDECYEAGLLPEAVAAYKALGATEKLLKCGQSAMEAGKLDLAQDAYSAAGDVLPLDKVLKLADGYLNDGRFREASHAYELAGAPKKLMECASRCLEEGLSDEALDACRAVARLDAIGGAV